MRSWKFLFKTAWRDARKDRGMLLMFMSAIVLGISALVAINAFNDALIKDVDRQAATLLGADLELESNSPISDSSVAVLDSFIADLSMEKELLSMAYFPQEDKSQFMRIKAVKGDFPYYGKILAEPQSSIDEIQELRSALVDKALMQEMELSVGDSIRLGETTFIISGRLERAFGNAAIGGSFAPTVYIGLKYLDKTRLIQPGSLVEHKVYIKVREGVDIDREVERYEDFFRSQSIQTETIASRKEELDEAFDSLNSFLNLVALVALLLGCIGVSSSIFVYVRRKYRSIAILRCLGSSGNDAMLIYLIQILVLGLISILLGVALGSLIQIFLPFILSDFLPVEVTLGISWSAIWEGLIIGAVLTSLFALWPLIKVKNIAPISVLRNEHITRSKVGWKSDIWLLVSIIGALWMTMWYLTGDFDNGYRFTLGMVIAFALLYGLSRITGVVLKRSIPRKIRFVWKQGIANLYRPNNQTSTLLVAIGLGTAVLSTLFIVQSMLLNNIERMDAGNQPNMILFGIETDQREGLQEMTADYDMPVIQQVPIVTMRLVGWQGRSKSQWLQDTNRTAESWVIHREARVTYRDSLDRSESLVAGEFVGSIEDPADSIFISLSEGFADALDVGIGDELVFNVQGARVKTYVSSLREIDFSTMQARFFIVFPTGVLEEAPQFHVLVTKSPDSRTTAQYRTDVVSRYPNISVVDLASILETVNKIFSKISYVIQFMAAFSILTGLLVLISSLWLSKLQRIRENALLRTLGASSRQLLSINAIEYAFIGMLASICGVLLALLSSYAITVYELDLEFYVNGWSIVLIILTITALTVAIGLWNTRDVLKRSPVDVLR
ncbi:MAG: FtsX-like permease family protein [Saprospiraceae bacterium]|nr:FtsX-like permease family protein [Saprospiraceae bacterium]